ncbi:hypothetical protein T4D_11341 [Trichinella pseudospiralis]|uniref:Uncharacterized protein n=1 Tax=Trichinella pseudospiralis TaxID=6337 RepID=A0A0V1F9X9_TRIPS|nr:hypothetical protein T4D_11341 [Trichinella pseudospiralis]
MSKASKNHILLSAVSFVIRKEPQSSIVDNCAMFKLLSCKKIFSPIDIIDLLENKYEDHRSTNRVSKLNMINSRRKDKIFPLPAVFKFLPAFSSFTHTISMIDSADRGYKFSFSKPATPYSLGRW